MIDDPFASVQPRRRQAVTAPPPDDDPFASVAPRDTLMTHVRNTVAPEQPSLLSRVGTAAKTMGQQIVAHPMETVKGIGKGLMQNTGDLLDLTRDPVQAGMRILTQEQGDPRRAAVRAGGAVALGLGPVARLLGAPALAVGALDYGAAAGLGAAQTPDDPAVGATLGLLTNAAVDAPGAVKSLRSGMIPKLDGVTAGMAEELTPRFPMRKGAAGMAAQDITKGGTLAKMMPGSTLDRLTEQASIPSRVANVFDAPQAPKPATTEIFPDGFTAEPSRRATLDRAMQTLLPRELFDEPSGTLTPVAPRDVPLPGTERQFPDGFTMPEPTPVKSATPKPVMPADEGLPSPTLATTGATRVVAPPTTPPVIPEAPPAPVVAAAEPPAPVSAPVSAPAAAPTVETPAAPTMEPAKDVFVNWRTLDNSNAPLGTPTLDRIKALATASDDRLKQERGFQSLDAQADAAMKSQAIQDLFDDPLVIDRKKLQGLTGAQVVAVKDVMNENARMAEVISREMASGKLSGDDLTLAQQRLEQLTASTNEALATVVGESARMGRDLGALRVMSKLSTDPDVWMVQAKKMLGDQPMTEQIMNDVRRLAREAADACGGA